MKLRYKILHWLGWEFERRYMIYGKGSDGVWTRWDDYYDRERAEACLRNRRECSHGLRQYEMRVEYCFWRLLE